MAPPGDAAAVGRAAAEGLVGELLVGEPRVRLADVLGKVAEVGVGLVAATSRAGKPRRWWAGRRWWHAAWRFRGTKLTLPHPQSYVQTVESIHVPAYDAIVGMSCKKKHCCFRAQKSL